MWKIEPNTNKSIIIYTYIHRICLQQWDYLKRPGKEEKEKRMIVNNIEIYHICVGTRYNKMH
jgi:hypothetical protein